MTLSANSHENAPHLVLLLIALNIAEDALNGVLEFLLAWRILQTHQVILVVLFGILFVTLAFYIDDISSLKLEQKLFIVIVKHLFANILTLDILNEFDDI